MTYGKHIRAGLVLAAFVASSVPVHGQPPIVVEGLPTAIVSYGDLDLSSPRGQATLNGRVRRAAEALCVDQGSRDLGRTMAGRACITFALNHAQGQVDRAVAQFGNPQYAGRSTVTIAGR